MINTKLLDTTAVILLRVTKCCKTEIQQLLKPTTINKMKTPIETPLYSSNPPSRIKALLNHKWITYTILNKQQLIKKSIKPINIQSIHLKMLYIKIKMNKIIKKKIKKLKFKFQIILKQTINIKIHQKMVMIRMKMKIIMENNNKMMTILIIQMMT